jgi:flagellar hook-associated protein 2
MAVTSSSSSAVLQSLGIGSGLDINGIIGSLMNANSQPLTTLQSKARGIQTEISQYGQLSAAYAKLQTAIKGLREPAVQNSLLGLTSSSSTSSVASSSVSGAAAPGNYTLKVDQLAKGQQLVSTGGEADLTTKIGGGTLKIQLGTISGGSGGVGTDGAPGVRTGAAFAPKGESISIEIGPDSTLADIRDAINSSNSGVSASLINDGAQYRLALSSTGAGAATSISIEATGDAALTSLLGQDPAGAQAFQETQAAGDLKGSLNGIAITASGNTLDKTLSGLTITASGVGTSTLSVSQNPTQAASALGAFVSAWNGLNALVKSATSYDQTTKAAGALLGDPLAGQAFNSMINATFSALGKGSGNYSTLASIGLTIDAKGVASIDNTALGKALTNDPKSVANLFSTTKGDILAGASQTVDSMVGSNGIGGRTAALASQLKANEKQQDDWANRLAIMRKNLTAQYTALDASVSKMQSVSSFLSNQIAQYNKS